MSETPHKPQHHRLLKLFSHVIFSLEHYITYAFTKAQLNETKHLNGIGLKNKILLTATNSGILTENSAPLVPKPLNGKDSVLFSYNFHPQNLPH